MADLVVASFNVHAGVDGWGRPFDVVTACRRMDADVLVLQEAWTPASGGQGTATEVGEALGYQVVSHPLAHCALLPPPDPGVPISGWGPGFLARQRHWYGPRLLDGDVDPPAPRTRPTSMSMQATALGRPAEAEDVVVPLGLWGLAVLTRSEPVRTEVLDLGRLPRDQARRGAVVVHLEPGRFGGPVRVVGTHMSHLTAGSPRQLRRLAAALGLRSGPVGDVVVAGDMNLWGPPVSACLPGLRRVVRGRSWPAYRPLAQIDHILAGPRLAEGVAGEVMHDAGSDHRPIRARFRLSRT